MRPAKYQRWIRAIAVVAALLTLGSLTGPVAVTAAPSKAELERARERLMELERDFEIVVERYNLVHERLNGIQAGIATAQLDVDRISNRMRIKEQAAVRIATELYKGGTTQALESVLASESLNDIDRGLVYLEHSEAAQTEVFQPLGVQKALLSREIAALEVRKQAALAEEERLDELRVQIEGKIAEQHDEVTRLNELIQAAEQRAARRAARAARRAAQQQTAPAQPVTIRPAPAPNKAAGVAVEAAMSQIGKPYQWAASGPDSYDCSGLTMWAWAQAGVSLPHNSGMQYASTPRVERSDLQPGDLVFFGSPIHHVGLYLGNGQMVEAPYTGAQVRVVSMSRSDYVGAGRPGV